MFKCNGCKGTESFCIRNEDIGTLFPKLVDFEGEPHIFDPPPRDHQHVWRKMHGHPDALKLSTPEIDPKLQVRYWSCHCGAVKRRESQGSAPRETVNIEVR